MTLKRLQALRRQAENYMPLYWALTLAISLFLNIPEQANHEARYLEQALQHKREREAA